MPFRAGMKTLVFFSLLGVALSTTVYMKLKIKGNLFWNSETSSVGTLSGDVAKNATSDDGLTKHNNTSSGDVAGKGTSSENEAGNGTSSENEAGNGTSSENGAGNGTSSEKGTRKGTSSENGARNGTSSENGAGNGTSSENGARNGTSSENGARKGTSSENGARNGTLTLIVTGNETSLQSNTIPWAVTEGQPPLLRIRRSCRKAYGPYRCEEPVDSNAKITCKSYTYYTYCNVLCNKGFYSERGNAFTMTCDKERNIWRPTYAPCLPYPPKEK